MRIGARRAEEARVHDSFEGYHTFHTEETQDEYGSFLVYWQDAQRKTEDEDAIAAGWYWRAEFPGCPEDGEPCGPFGSSRDALRDADEWAPEFDGEF